MAIVTISSQLGATDLNHDARKRPIIAEAAGGVVTLGRTTDLHQAEKVAPRRGRSERSEDVEVEPPPGLILRGHRPPRTIR